MINSVHSNRQHGHVFIHGILRFFCVLALVFLTVLIVVRMMLRRSESGTELDFRMHVDHIVIKRKFKSHIGDVL